MSFRYLFFTDAWNTFDFSIVGISVAELVMSEPIRVRVRIRFGLGLGLDRFAEPEMSEPPNPNRNPNPDASTTCTLDELPVHV